MAGTNCGSRPIGNRTNFSPKHQQCKPQCAPQCAPPSAGITKTFAKSSSAEQHINKHHYLHDHNHSASPDRTGRRLHHDSRTKDCGLLRRTRRWRLRSSWAGLPGNNVAKVDDTGSAIPTDNNPDPASLRIDNLHRPRITPTRRDIFGEAARPGNPTVSQRRQRTPRAAYPGHPARKRQLPCRCSDFDSVPFSA